MDQARILKSVIAFIEDADSMLYYRRILIERKRAWLGTCD